MELVETIDLAAIIVTVFFFGVGSYYDLKRREVDDWVWMIYAPIGAVLTAARVILEPALLTTSLISIAITALLSFGLFYFGLFGGADFKAVVCLGLTLPLPPTTIQPLIGYVHPVFPLTVVIEGFICEAFAAVWIGVGNLLSYAREDGRMFEGLEHESRLRKASAMILGYRTTLAKLRSTFYLYPMEQSVKDDAGEHRALKLYVNAETERDEEVKKFCDSAKLTEESKVWVTPGLPMLLFILIGFVLTIILGDMIFGTVLMMAHR
jgi:preflagellin peptidase FlaK